MSADPYPDPLSGHGYGAEQQTQLMPDILRSVGRVCLIHAEELASHYFLFKCVHAE